jgi:hypothetical protein
MICGIMSICELVCSVRRLMMGMPKANAFPVRFFTRAMISRPSSAGTKTAL